MNGQKIVETTVRFPIEVLKQRRDFAFEERIETTDRLPTM